jgi:hypothetical protein
VGPGGGGGSGVHVRLAFKCVCPGDVGGVQVCVQEYLLTQEQTIAESRRGCMSMSGFDAAAHRRLQARGITYEIKHFSALQSNAAMENGTWK